MIAVYEGDGFEEVTIVLDCILTDTAVLEDWA